MHPTPEQLEAFGRGRIDETEAEAIEAHVADCGLCAERLLQTSIDDNLVGLLQRLESRGGGNTAPLSTLIHEFPAGYDRLELVGRGGMGVVYRARQRSIGRIVALKQIAAGQDATGQERNRFRAEVEAIGRLQHPNIVPVYDVGELEDGPYFTMEFLEGGTLGERLAGGPLGTVEAAHLVSILARAIGHAHEAGIVHRDLKPVNILFTRVGFPKVADFGLAKQLAMGSASPTRSGALLGTPSYMAPEQTLGKPEEVGTSADIYALGALLYESITGRPPFQAPTPLETLDQVRSIEPIPPQQLQPGIPKDLETICLTCLAKIPQRRYPTAIELAADLDRFLNNEPINARATPPWLRLSKWCRRHPTSTGITGLSAVLVFGTIVGVLVHHRSLQIAYRRVEASAREAEDQRNRADANYREARATIQSMLGRLEHRSTQNISDTALHRTQLEDALGFYQVVLETATPADETELNPIVGLDTARAHREAANVQIALGLAEEAEANLGRSLALLDRLLELTPDDSSILRELMLVHLKLGVLLSSQHPERAITALNRAVGFAEERYQKQPDPAKAIDLSWSEHNLGSALQHGGYPGRAAKHYRRAIELRRPVVDDLPDDLGSSVMLAQTLNNLGLLKTSGGEFERANLLFEEAKDRLNQAITVDPSNIEYVASLGDLLLNAGNLKLATGNLGAAIESYQSGLVHLESIMTRGSDLVRVRQTALNLNGALAQALMVKGDYPTAATHWEAVVALGIPGEHWKKAGLVYIALTLAMSDPGENVERICSIAEELESATLSGIDRYNLSCALALCVSNQEASDRTRVDPVAAQALHWLRRALETNPELAAGAESDADLSSLRSLPDYRSILDAALTAE